MRFTTVLLIGLLEVVGLQLVFTQNIFGQAIDPAKGGYTIVLNSSEHPDTAMQKAAQFQQMGLDVNVLKMKAGNTYKYRICVGQYTTKQAAIDDLDRTKSKSGVAGAWQTALPADAVVVDSGPVLQTTTIPPNTISKPVPVLKDTKYDSLATELQQLRVQMDKQVKATQAQNQKAIKRLEDSLARLNHRLDMDAQEDGVAALPKAKTTDSISILTPSSKPEIHMSAYVDAYYATDDDRSVVDFRNFTVLGATKDHFAINMAQLSAGLSSNRARSTLTIQAGTIRETAFDGLVHYPFIQEANAGVRLWRELWLEGGYFLTHIGGEYLVPKSNWFASHAMITNFEPFYQSGMRVSYTFSESLLVDAHLLNGSGIIEDNNHDKSVGWSVDYYPAEGWNIYYSGLFGNERDQGTPKANRLYQSLWLQYEPTEHLAFMGQADYAMEENAAYRPDSTLTTGSLFGAYIAVKWLLSSKFSLSTREEYFEDTDLVGGFHFAGVATTGCLEYRPTDHAFIRLEERYDSFDKKYPVFQDHSHLPSNHRWGGSLSIGVWLD